MIRPEDLNGALNVEYQKHLPLKEDLIKVMILLITQYKVRNIPDQI